MLRSLKRTVSQVPVLGRVVTKIYRGVRGSSNPVFTNSAEYWDSRYKTGGNSGSGSYNELAVFKADVLNEFIRSHHVETVLEFGCGDGAQLALAEYPNYIGVDVSESAVEICRARHQNDPSKQFHLIGAGQPTFTADLTLSLDVIYHLVEDRVFNLHMASLFDASKRYVAVYASNDDRVSPDPHVRHRRFVTWIEQQRPGWRQIGFVKNKYPWDAARPRQTSFADFYFFEKTPKGLT
jgi:cyclopropane fatty-acyl-phospholipid synthase-like methyltransferase